MSKIGAYFVALGDGSGEFWGILLHQHFPAHGRGASLYQTFMGARVPFYKTDRFLHTEKVRLV